MSEIKRVKIQSFIESQIPEFLNSDSPLFKEFLEQYYISQEHQTGVVDLTTNLQKYKSIENFNTETFYSLVGICTLTSNLASFDDTLYVNHTIGFPQQYGLLKIDDEIITYTGITTNSFTGCIRGFCGLEKNTTNESFKFSSTDSSDHIKGSQVINLNTLFFQELFKKFKTQFLPGFEDRNFTDGVNLQTILSRAKDFYISKGTDTSFKILFSILFNESISVIKPQEYVISPSSNEYLVTKNILVEQIIRDANLAVSDSILRTELKGKTIFQTIEGNKTASASIYNIEYRPVNTGDFVYNSIEFNQNAQKNYTIKDFYEISLDSTSFILNFKSTKKTKVLENVSKNSTSILVDSTIGFKRSGTLLIKPKNLSNPIILSYTDKTINEFLNVTGLTIDLDYGAEIIEEEFLYSYLNDGAKVEFRLINIIDNIDYEKTSNLRFNDKIQLSSFGVDLNDRLEFNNWIYNIPTTHDIKSIDKKRIYFYETLNFLIEDEVTLFNPDSPDVNEVKVEIEGFGFNSFGYFIDIKGSESNTFRKTKIKRVIHKALSNNNYFSNISAFPTGIQNSYIDYNNENFYVTSSGLPNYEINATDRKTFVSAGIGVSILNCPNHNFFTGEKVYYNPKSENIGIETSAYFVTKIDEDNIKLSYSNSDVFSKDPRGYVYTKNYINGDYIVKFDFQNKTLNHQKLFKKFNLRKKLNKFLTKDNRSTIDKATGILINGVEVFSPTLYDENIYYGKLDSINITSGGKGYDIINFSGLEVNDANGSNAELKAHLTGSLSEVKILRPGIGYSRKPKITLSGGNGSGAVLESNLVKTNIISNFKASTAVSIGFTTIDFINGHNFDDTEEVSYINNSNGNINPLVNNSNYFVGIVSSTQLKLYKTKEKALGKTDPIVFTGIGTGTHSLKSLNSKTTITKIYVKNRGEGYSNRSVSINVLDETLENNQGNYIDIFDNYIFAKNHNFKDQDIIQYQNNNTPISGLSTQTNYYVKVIDENKFKLSIQGPSGSEKINYEQKKYVGLNSEGKGIHTFSYLPIQINVEYVSGITTTPLLEPIVLGSVESIFVSNEGKNYGSSDIINYHRRPYVGLSSISSECILKPVLLNGTIVDVQVLNSGKGYKKDIDIKIFGKGKYAELYPIVEEGKIKSINVLNPGIGYDEKTTLFVQRRGSDAKFIANVFEWKINQVEKNKDIISPRDEGLIVPSKNNNSTLQFIHFYPSKKLRYNVNNFISKDEIEIAPDNNQNPYKILGWAYDGNPIFGPYGKINGQSRLLKSSYKLKNFGDIGISITKHLRPDFPSGFFIQDYFYNKGNGDLDEYNGMFIDDRNLPNINYGYFATLTEDTNVPQYPYVLPSSFKDFPIEENFNPKFNQEINFEELDIVRNVGPYYLNSNNSTYELIDKVDQKYKQEFIVKEIKLSGINSISIFDDGDGYKVGDSITFENQSSGGNSVSASISRIKGKPVSNVQVGILTFTDVEFITKGISIKGIASQPHNLVSDDEIFISNISSSDFDYLKGTKKIYVFQKTTGLIEDVQSQSVTGVTTYIKVNDVAGFEVDNFIGIGTETLKVIDVSPSESKLYVNRFDNYSGIHSVGLTSITLLPNSFTFSSEFYDNSIVENNTTYFNPTNTIGIGTTSSIYYNIVGFQTFFGTLTATGLSTIGVNTTLLQVGDYVSGSNLQDETTIISIGINTISISPDHTLGGGISTSLLSFSRKIYNKTIPSRSIYIPSHKYYTGQPVTYNVGLGGTGIIVSETGAGTTFRLTNNQTIYAVNLGKDYVGLSTLGFTTNTGIGTTQNSLYFFNPINNVGLSHSLTTQFEKIKGVVNNYSVVVSTSQTHGLQTGDNINFNFNQSNTKTIKIRYDNVIRKITTELIDFDPISGIDTSTNEIEISGNNLKTGDKIVYYTEGQTSVGGLSTNSVYYVLKQDLNKIKLCNYQYDTSVGIAITLTSVGAGSTHSLALINPPINILKRNILSFDLSDNSLLDMDLKLYRDSNFTQELETFKYSNYDERKLDTNLSSIPTEIYYNLVSLSNQEIEKNQLSSDNEVVGFNKIKIIPNNINTYHTIIKTGNSQFKFNLNTIPEPLTFISGLSTSNYDTDSKNAIGPISNIRVNFGGRGYKKVPKISTIQTSLGKGASLEAKSSSIGKIENLERVKDGFDYPNDITLKPYLSVPAVAQVGDISRIEYIGIVTGGKNYNTAPTLKVLGNDKIKLSANLQSGSVVSIDIVQNTNDLINPLRIIPIRNSNGYEIDSVVSANNGSSVTLELLNNSELYPLITTGYGNTSIVFPFSEGDEIFIENCRQVDRTKDNINSKDYDYRFFTVTSVSPENYTITFSMTGVKDSLNLSQDNGESNYENGFGYGYVVNKKDMAEFEMNLVDDLSYISGESVVGFDRQGNAIFSAKVAEDGWDNEINQLRMIDVKGELEIGNKLKGEKSLLNGTIKDINIFNLKANLGISRDKVNDNKNESGFLNDYLQRISDNFYYQKFSYAIKSQLSYDKWKEPVRSIIHPSGFKEFSDLDIISKANTNLKVGVSSNNLSLNVLMDNVQSLYSKNNFTLISEDEDNLFEDGSIERVNIGAEEGIIAGVGTFTPIFGIPLKQYILNKTNKVLLMNDISQEFDGSNDYISLGTTSITFNSLTQYYVGISTTNLNVGDYLGNSEFLIPEATRIESIGINSVRINLPHRLTNGISTTNAEIRRRLPGNEVVGEKSFELTSGTGSDKVPLYYREFNSNSTEILKLDNNIIELKNHNFQTGQKIFYNQSVIDVEPVGSATTEVDNGFSYTISNKFDLTDNIMRFDMTIFTFNSN